MSNAGLPPDTGDGTPEGDGIGHGRLRRAAPLVALSARTAGEAVVVGLRSKLTGADSTEFHVRTAERYAELLGRSKGALMKAGQMLSFVSAGPAVPGEFQSIYHAALARLRDDAPPMAPELSRAVLERELGQRTESVFAEFDWRPLAAASIGQVHAAQLHDGREVAVKIQYPGVAAAIRADLKNNELLYTLLALILGLFPKRASLDIRGAARELSVRISEELDYRLEATNQTAFADIYRGHPFIHIPEVVAELCTERVLTQELVRGRSWSEALSSTQELRDSWAEAIYRFVYGTNHRFSLFHADPHPGNYLFHDDGSVSFLDFGCAKRFAREQVEIMNAIGRACLREDVLGTWRASVEGGFWRSTDPVSPEEVFTFWREPWELWWGEQPFTLTPEHLTKGIERRFSPTGPSARAFRYLTFPPEYAIMGRIELGGASLVAELHARNHWKTIVAEFFEGAEPFTAMGKLDHEFFANRRAALGHA
ncbi:MAG TPA: AarF/ABC1/UbiB kinase family protein [Solirubrobacteraceae bacterium]|nr:AarF/ABC1/UbiB kinase family protein [Solirubrobacteraceae bacterium]